MKYQIKLIWVGLDPSAGSVVNLDSTATMAAVQRAAVAHWPATFPEVQNGMRLIAGGRMLQPSQAIADILPALPALRSTDPIPIHVTPGAGAIHKSMSTGEAMGKAACCVMQ